MSKGAPQCTECFISRDPPTAVFCANDIQAIGALSECRESGISVPKDISIIGFDDLPIAEYIIPKLTTVRVPAQEMGDHAANRLITAIETGEPVLPLELPTDLVIRETTAINPGRRFGQVTKAPRVRGTAPTGAPSIASPYSTPCQATVDISNSLRYAFL